MNLGQLRAALARRTGLPLVQDATDEYLNAAVQLIDADFDWPWLQAAETLTTTSGTATADPAADWARTVDVRHADTNEALVRLSMQELDDQYDPDETGRPRAYAIWGDQLHLGPAPDGGYDLTHRYVKRESELVAEGDEPAMPSAFHYAIVEHAALLAFSRVGDQKGMEAAERGYRLWRERMADDRRRASAPIKVRVRSDSPF